SRFVWRDARHKIFRGPRRYAVSGLGPSALTTFVRGFGLQIGAVSAFDALRAGLPGSRARSRVPGHAASSFPHARRRRGSRAPARLPSLLLRRTTRAAGAPRDRGRAGPVDRGRRRAAAARRKRLLVDGDPRPSAPAAARCAGPASRAAHARGGGRYHSRAGRASGAGARRRGPPGAEPNPFLRRRLDRGRGRDQGGVSILAAKRAAEPDAVLGALERVSW